MIEACWAPTAAAKVRQAELDSYNTDIQRGKSRRIDALHARLHLDASYKVIVSDGGSSDGTAELAANMPPPSWSSRRPAVGRLRRGETTVPDRP
jgi:hypothetical protein